MINRSHGRLSRVTLGAAIALALGTGTVSAQTDKERELEARVAQLEAMVQQLVSQQQAIQGAQEEVRVEQAQQAARLDRLPIAPEGTQPVQASTILPGANPGARFSYGGFVKLDAMITDTSDGPIAEGSAGRLFYVPGTIPVVANGAEPDTDPYTDFHAAFSRFWFAVDHTTDDGDKFRGFIEADLFGGGSSNLGNEVSTNTHGVTIRHAFVTFNEWLAGLTWTNFQDVAALPDTVDFVGVSDGSIFVRQAQVRYSKGPWSVSLENPHTTVSAVATAARDNNGGNNTLPDFTARYTLRGDWGHFSAAGLLRQMKTGEETASGAAVSLSGRINLGANDDIRYMVNYGSGIGRYLGFGLGADSVLDANGELHSQDGGGGFVGWRHAFSPKLRSNLVYSTAFFDNDRGLAGWGAGSYAAVEKASSLRANLIYSPFPKLDVGAEISYSKRELEDDREGDMTRFHTTVKYSF